jgi:AcrR family transcriptional regulator
VTPVSPQAADRRPVGRPPRISRDAIIEAANELGLEGLTLRSVADHLGVSIAALYHHVSGKDDLMRLAAAHSASKVPLPKDEGQHWATWLYEWACYNRDAFTREPALLGQYVDGAITSASMVDNLELALRVLVRQGFTVEEAATAYEQVTALAIGVAVGALRQRQAGDPGSPLDDLDGLSADHPHLAQLVAARAASAPVSFRDRVITLLRGIAVERADDPAEVVARLDKTRRRL